MRQLHTYGAKYTLTCWTCRTSEFLGYEKPDVFAVMAKHPSHEMSLDTEAITFASASKEDLELMRCTGCPECEGENNFADVSGGEMQKEKQVSANTHISESARTFTLGKTYSFTSDSSTVTGRVEGVFKNQEQGIFDVRVRGYGWLDLNEWRLVAGKTK